MEREDLQRLDGILKGFIGAADASSAFLIDPSGQLITSAGSTHGVDHASFGSLAAADFAASGQLAGLLGEQEFRSLYHQGPKNSMFMVDVGGRAILAALFDDRTTLGMVRLRTRSVVPELASVFEAMDGRAPRTGGQRLDMGWANEAADEIDRLLEG